MADVSYIRYDGDVELEVVMLNEVDQFLNVQAFVTRLRTTA